MKFNNKGFGIIEIIIIAVIIVIIGFVGWKAWDAYTNNKGAETAKEQSGSTDQAPPVTDDSGLDESSAALDASKIDDNESTQLNTQIDF